MGWRIFGPALAVGAMTGSALLSMATGAGVAGADDYTGQKYSDVTTALADAGLTGVIATRSGDSLDDDDCVVTKSSKAPWLKGDDFTPVTDTVLLNLNCNAAVASATTPGNSAASPEGRKAIADAKAKAAEDKAKAAAAKS
jgi:hypothetical protein